MYEYTAIFFHGFTSVNSFCDHLYAAWTSKLFQYGVYTEKKMSAPWGIPFPLTADPFQCPGTPHYSAISTKGSNSPFSSLDENLLKLDICDQRTRMPPASALSKMALWLRYWLLSDNYRSIKADLYNIERQMRDHADQKDLHLVCSQT